MSHYLAHQEEEDPLRNDIFFLPLHRRLGGKAEREKCFQTAPSASLPARYFISGSGCCFGPRRRPRWRSAGALAAIRLHTPRLLRFKKNPRGPARCPPRPGSGHGADARPATRHPFAHSGAKAGQRQPEAGLARGRPPAQIFILLSRVCARISGRRVDLLIPLYIRLGIKRPQLFTVRGNVRSVQFCPNCRTAVRLLLLKHGRAAEVRRGLRQPRCARNLTPRR